MDPRRYGYDVIVKDPEGGYSGSRLPTLPVAKEELSFLRKIRPKTTLWWLVDAITGEVIIEGGEGVGHKPQEYGYDPEKGILSILSMK
jgi:hypothetical protein